LTIFTEPQAAIRADSMEGKKSLSVIVIG